MRTTAVQLSERAIAYALRQTAGHIHGQGLTREHSREDVQDLAELCRAWLDFQDIAQATVSGGSEPCPIHLSAEAIKTIQSKASQVSEYLFEQSNKEPVKDYAIGQVCDDPSHKFYGWTRDMVQVGKGTSFEGWFRTDLDGSNVFITDGHKGYVKLHRIDSDWMPAETDCILAQPESNWANPMPEDPYDSEPDEPHQPGETVQGATPVHEVVEPIRVKVKPTLGDAVRIAMPAESAIKAVGKVTNSRDRMAVSGNLSLSYVDSLRKWLATERQCQIGQLGHEGHTVTDLREMIKAKAVNGQLVIPK